MERGATALRDTPRRRPPQGVQRAPARRSNEPHHRRRRSFALGLLALIAFIIGISVGAGGTGTNHGAARHNGYLGRVRTLAGTGPGSLVAAQQAAENAAIDRTLAYTPYVQFAGSQHREIALTFDDGPGPYTPRLLSVLESNGAPGTFFEVGSLERYFHDGTSRILNDGFPIGDHTETHAPLSHLPASEQQAQIIEETSRTGAYGAAFPRMFRPPYGLWNSTTLSLLRNYRMLMVLWTVDTQDYRRPGVPVIVNKVLSGARPGAIVLMHDAGGERSQTIAALPQIISGLRARGYKLVTVPRLIMDNPPPANQQVSAVAGSGG
jgi:peptidoglycan-N-acetylglucosamine deacetylase